MQNKRYYIAYGSNLSVEQMKVRCPDARIAGKSILKDWKLEFRVHATIERCVGSSVPVLVWEISDQDEQSLDRYEGWPVYYRKEEIHVNMTDLLDGSQKEITAMLYLMNDGHSITPPMQGYYDVLDRGYERFGFDRALLKNALTEAKEAAEHELS